MGMRPRKRRTTAPGESGGRRALGDFPSFSSGSLAKRVEEKTPKRSIAFYQLVRQLLCVA